MADLETNIQGRVIELIRWRFSDPNRIQDPRLKGYVYAPKAEINPLPIQSGAYSKPPGSPAPAVYVLNQGLNTGSLNPLHGYTVEIDGVDRVSGSFVDFDSGNVMVLCEGKTSGQAGAIGWEVYSLLRHYAPLLKEEYNLFHASPVQFKSGEPLQEGDGQQPVVNYAASIGFPWYRINAWDIGTEESSP